MTPVHEFTHKVELANEELRIVHCTFAVDSKHDVKFALIGNKVVEIKDCVLKDTDNKTVQL